jgi:hypothetical protein
VGFLFLTKRRKIYMINDWVLTKCIGRERNESKFRRVQNKQKTKSRSDWVEQRSGKAAVRRRQEVPSSSASLGEGRVE